MIFLRRQTSFYCQHINDSLLKTSRKQSDIGHPFLCCLGPHPCILTDLFAFRYSRSTRSSLLLACSLCKVQHGGFEAAEAKVIRSAQPGTREPIGVTG